VLEVVELPLAAKAQKTAAQLALHGGRQRVVGIREEVGARSQPVFTNELDVFPVIHMSSRNKATLTVNFR
jgi:uracil-DNA glycosylase